MTFVYILLLLILLGQITQNRKANNIMATQKEAAIELTKANQSLTKIGTETTTLLEKIVALEAAVASNGDGQVSPELQSAIDGVVDQAQKIDDLVPDATGTIPTPGPTPAPDQPSV